MIDILYLQELRKTASVIYNQAMVAVKSIDIIKCELEKYGCTFNDIIFSNGKIYTEIVSDNHDMLLLSTNNPLYPFATASARLICRDKSLSYEYASRKDVRIPNTLILTSKNTSDIDNFIQNNNSLIVKPLNASGAVGLTLDITNRHELDLAVNRAFTHSQSVIIQEQVYGEEVRLTVVKGKVVATLLREKPKILGNGIRSVKELIEDENILRAKILNTMVPYPQLTSEIIIDEYFSDNTIPENGEIIELSKGTMIKTGASIYNVIDEIDNSYVSIVEKLAKGLGNGFVVVDMIIQDYKAPITEHNYAFIEFNLTPALSLYYSCRDGNHVQIVEQYLAPMILKTMV